MAVALCALLPLVACGSSGGGGGTTASGGTSGGPACSKDTDCKGNRICTLGRCVSPDGGGNGGTGNGGTGNVGNGGTGNVGNGGTGNVGNGGTGNVGNGGNGGAGGSTDPCQGNNCSGHGTCAGGVCTCQTGYVGTACDQCATGYTGYPNCQQDPCIGVDCSGHGTCSGGVCNCNTGYSGATCGQCASGYGLYPNCTPCNCSSGTQQCNGSNALNQCTNGCTWTSSSCAAVCQADGYVYKSTGCAWDWTASQDDCWCPKILSDDDLLITMKDTCNDGYGPNVGFYDTTANLSWGPYFLQTYNQNLSEAIECRTGDKICWGAWQGTKYWGCGQNCAQTCTNCCYTCGAQLSISVPLGC